MQAGQFQVTLAPDLWGRMQMKRDMELVRDVLLRIQEKTDLKPEIISIEGRDETGVWRHIEMLIDAGMIDASVRRNGVAGRNDLFVVDLTWEGHDFLAALSNKTVWNRMKEAYSADQLATMPLEILKGVGGDLLMQWAKSQVGLQ